MFNSKTIAFSVAFIISIIVIVVMALNYLVPAPPKKIVIATGSQTGEYYRLGNEYKKLLEKNGLEVELLVTKGSVENLELLNDSKQKVDIAFVQSGISSSKEYPQLQSLAGVFYEPLWLIHHPQAFKDRKSPPDKILDLVGKKISIGLPGSGTRKLVGRIFELNQINTNQPNWIELGADQSFEKLKAGEIDAMFISVSNHAPIMQKIFVTDLEIMNFAKAYGYPPRIQGLSVLSVRRATLDIVTDTPNKDILLISSTAELVTKKDLHPAISNLMISLSSELLSDEDILSGENHFPKPNNLTFDPNEDAQKIMKDGPSFLNRYLPFWVAVWVERLLRVGVPLLAILIPIFNFLPSILEYRKKYKFASIYQELRAVENKINLGTFDKKSVDDQMQHILDRTIHLKVSQFNTKEIYELISHIEDVQRRLESHVTS
jgi:TRAP transporter TAXI family solute receptor